MRILKISQFYPAYLAYLEKKVPQQGRYEDLLLEVLHDGFSWADFYTDAFRAQGHEAAEIIHNCDWLQKKYAKEIGSPHSGLKLLSEQIRRFKPDILFLDTLLVTREWVNQIRSDAPSIKQIGIFNCSPASLKSLELFKACDFVITCHRGINESYRAKGLNSFHVFHAFGEKLLTRLEKQNIKNQILFSGSLFSGSDLHNLRLEALEDFVKNSLPFAGYAYQDHTPELIFWLKRCAYDTAKAFEKIPNNPLAKFDIVKRVQAWKEQPQKLNISKSLQHSLKEPLFGLAMYQELASSLVTFNIHGGIAGRYASNMRMFEATGVGSCLFTDAKDDLYTLFAIDTEIVTYASLDECREKARWLLAHPDQARGIGLAGQKRALRDHTYTKRAEQMLEIFNSQLSSSNA